MFKKGKPYRAKIIDFTLCMGSIPGMVLGMHGINMYEDSMEVKIWRVAYPVLLCLFINMIVQVIFTIGVTMAEFSALNDGSVWNYFSAYNFSGDIERVVSENTLIVTLLSGIITIPVALRLMKRDEDAVRYMPVKEHISNIRFHSSHFIVALGALASAGISKVVTIFPIDNIIGSYESIRTEFASNDLIWQITALVFAGPCMEELIFRGLVYKRIKRYTNNMSAVYISAIMFGVYHFNLVQGIYGFALGVLLCYVYEKYETILAPVLLHISANLTALVIDYLPVSEDINNNIYLKVLLMLIEVGAMVAVLWRMNNIDGINKKRFHLVDIKYGTKKEQDKE